MFFKQKEMYYTRFCKVITTCSQICKQVKFQNWGASTRSNWTEYVLDTIDNPPTFDVKKLPITDMRKYSMWKQEADNKTFSTRLPPIERQQKETQYSGWHNDTTGEGLWSGKDNEVP